MSKKRNKSQKYYTEEQQEIRKFIIIILVLSIVVGLIYILTDKFVDSNVDENYVKGEINYDVTSIGSLLNRPYDNYYVIIYDKDNTNAVYYSNLISKYIDENQASEDYAKIYYVDLSNNLNKKYYNVGNDNVSNPSAKSINELDLGDLTLIKVSNGSIVEYYEDASVIENILLSK